MKFPYSIGYYQNKFAEDTIFKNPNFKKKFITPAYFNAVNSLKNVIVTLKQNV